MTIIAMGVLLHWTQANSFELVVRQTPHASKNKRHKPYFFTHVVTVALRSSKILTDGKLHWPSGWQQKHFWSKHPLQSNLQSISKRHFFA